jgi:hypothetical protein
VHLGQREEQRREPLTALHDAEFGGGLDRVVRVEAGIREADDLRLGTLRLEQEGGEVARPEGMPYGTLDLAALRRHVFRVSASSACPKA